MTPRAHEHLELLRVHQHLELLRAHEHLELLDKNTCPETFAWFIAVRAIHSLLPLTLVAGAGL